MARKIKGSLSSFDDGSFVFTPYKSDPTKSNYEKIVKLKNGTFRLTKNYLEVSIKMQRTPQTDIYRALYDALMNLLSDYKKFHDIL